MRDSKCGSLWHPGGGHTTYSTSSQMTGTTPLIKTSGAIRTLFLKTTSESPSLSASSFYKRSLIYSLKPQILQPSTKRFCWDDPKEILCLSLMPHFVALYSRQTQTLLSTILRVCVYPTHIAYICCMYSIGLGVPRRKIKTSSYSLHAPRTVDALVVHRITSLLWKEVVLYMWHFTSPREKQCSFSEVQYDEKCTPDLSSYF